MRLTEEEYQAMMAKRKAPVSKPPDHFADARKMIPKKSKYSAIKTVVDGITFDSKAEARYFTMLKNELKEGRVLWFIRQPAFDLPGGVKYRADFLIVRPDGVHVIDVKGFETKEFKARKKMVEALYPIKLEVLKK